MKRLFRNLFAGLLAAFARAAVRKYRPTIVMVTGSVGKTSTKDAVAAALSRARYVRASEKSYNSEFGVPLTILGAANPWTSPIAWIRVFGEAALLLLFPNHYPKVLVLEVGADRPGDLARILKIAAPDAVVLTRLPEVPVHVEAYATPEAVREEEFQPAYMLRPGNPLILAADDAHAAALAKPLEARLVFFGSSNDADVALGAPELLIEDGTIAGMKAEVRIAGKAYPILVRGALGAPQLLAPAAALATALALDVSLKQALEGLAAYEPPPGRGRLLKGREGSRIIDDTYNSSPAASEEALASLALAAAHTPGSRRIAVLADMLELGRYSQEEHARIGRLAAERSDILVTVGPRARAIAEAALGAGMEDANVRSFATSLEAAPEVAAMAREKDVILVKGSQSMRMERVVEALLADPDDRKLLVRQDREWKIR